MQTLNLVKYNQCMYNSKGEHVNIQTFYFYIWNFEKFP